MASDLEKRAKEAFFEDEFEVALDLYSRALELDPKNADLYADRAQANIKLKNFAEAVADANRAIELDPSLSKAYLRKGLVKFSRSMLITCCQLCCVSCSFRTACIKLEEHQTAKAALEAGSSLAPGDSRFVQLIKECNELMAEETHNLPEKAIHETPPSAVTPSEDVGPNHDTSYQSTVVEPSKPKYRHDFYNTSTELVLTIFAKGILAKCVTVDFGEQILSVSIDIPGEEAYHFQPRLFGKIIPEKCKYQVLSSKIEIRLFKAEAIIWTSLEFSKVKALPQKINASAAVKSQRPSYPSSKSNKDWDKLEAQVKKEEKEEKLDGDAALNKMFHDIYRDADEDMRRAMTKSFVESNGTVLSTNWKEVGSKKVEGSPPDGMELKKWEY
ncbi:protein SGT1 homolog isoform X2 [Phoenix dactylifera]|uniref:Protein SGT1 homolog n=1 Tax=Phoenix dactylifera TaxID=42345 RepID=A0A8B9AUQ3_PHODC|nr:protein SGT1 homolog isoform X2 [Phoenix dactylifera]